MGPVGSSVVLVLMVALVALAIAGMGQPASGLHVSEQPTSL